jgi:hypothetical protein
MASFVCSVSNFLSDGSTPFDLANFCYSAVPDGSAFNGCMRAQMSCRVYVPSEPDTVWLEGNVPSSPEEFFSNVSNGFGDFVPLFLLMLGAFVLIRLLRLI